MSSLRSHRQMLGLAVTALVGLASLTAGAVTDQVKPRGDPTRPERWVASSDAPQLSSPTLNSVLIGNGRKLAVIDGRVMAEGERQAGIKLWQVQADRVVVSMADGARVTLRLPNPLNKSINKEVR